MENGDAEAQLHQSAQGSGDHLPSLRTQTSQGPVPKQATSPHKGPGLIRISILVETDSFYGQGR